MHNFMNKHKLFICLVFISGILLFNKDAMIVRANKMYNVYPGETHPGGTHPISIETAIGTDFNITCYINPKTFPRKNSTCLHFVIGRTNEDLPSENIVVVNSTTIIYMVTNASEQQTEYRCKCGHYAIMETKVFVGSRPRHVKDFFCRSYDFDYMICNFTKPSNPILTTYNVSYYNDLPSYIYQPHCNYDDRSLVVCNTSLKDRFQEMYHFTIESSNALVKSNEEPLIQRFDVNNFDIMIPAKPCQNMRVERLTVDTIILSWQMLTWEKYRPKGLQWEILLHPENSTVIHCDGPVREHNELRLRLNNLPYANWRYTLKIRVRVKNENAIWSEQFLYLFRTASCRPQRPPRVEPGSFYIDSSETRITVYWEELLPHEFNGDNFTYIITSVQTDCKISDHCRDSKPFYQEKNLAKFYWHKNLQYEFQIRSRNDIGESDETSRLIIYPIDQRNPKEFTPQAIHNVYHANNRTYTLTWSKPYNSIEISSFTVFWCYPKRALPNECKESISFQQVPADQFNFTTIAQNASEERMLNLAVSANYYKYNTGLHWTDCSMDIVNTDFVKMEPELMVSSNSIKVQWSVERVCPSILDGFNITYCEVAYNAVAENATCLNSAISKLAKNYDKKYYINNLKPFTTYKVTMLMFWRTKKGQPSDPLIIRTSEGAPSPPRQLRVDGITNSSASIKWMEPTHPNGKIRKYIIMLNNDQIEVNASTLSYHLENLESFTAYKVYVVAETVARSETSNDVHFTTAIGIPSPPGIGPNNNLANIIQWSKPVKPRGAIEFYEVLVTQLHNGEISRRRISVIAGATSCTFNKFPTCLGAEYKTTVEVRAVNAVPLGKNMSHLQSSEVNFIYDGNDDLECITSRSQKSSDNIYIYLNNSLYELYKSQWQTSAIFSCSTSRLSKITMIALLVIASSLSVMATLYMVRKKYNKMANIGCTLPAGLETYFSKETSVGFPADFNSGGHSIKEAISAEDEWMSAARMQEYNFRNEHHHLLASLGTDSSYLDGIGPVYRVNNSDNGFENNMLSSREETTKNSTNKNSTCEKDQVECEKDNLDLSSSSVDSLVVNTEESGCSTLVLEPAPVTIIPSNNCYMKPSILQPWQVFSNTVDETENLATYPPLGNGYITVKNLDHALKIPAKQNDFTSSTEDYVLQQDLQNFMSNISPCNGTNSSIVNGVATVSGYTTLEDLNILTMQSNLEVQNKSHADHLKLNDFSDKDFANIAVDSIDEDRDVSKHGVISGYVTQHDLNIFAQQQKNL